MKVKIEFERKDVLPAVLAVSWIVMFFLFLFSATGSIDEFEPQAALLWYVITGLWSIVPVVFLYIKKRGSLKS